jgi:hypothetical protein
MNIPTYRRGYTGIAWRECQEWVFKAPLYSQGAYLRREYINMSYEGYTQVLCKNGHYHTYDCYTWSCICDTSWDIDKQEPREWKCPICQASLAWRNGVNLTNGSFEVNPETGKEERIDGYVELEENGFEDVWHEDHYGNKYVTKLMHYKVPDEGERYERLRRSIQ